MALEPSVFASQTEDMLRKALCVTSPKARLTRKNVQFLLNFISCIYFILLGQQIRRTVR